MRKLIVSLVCVVGLPVATRGYAVAVVVLALSAWAIPGPDALAQVKDGRLKSGAFLSGEGSRLACRDDTDMDALLKELPDLRNLTIFSSNKAAATDEHLRVLAESCQLSHLIVRVARSPTKA